MKKSLPPPSIKFWTQAFIRDVNYELVPYLNVSVFNKIFLSAFLQSNEI
jgi:hypothetical protein